ncbi:MAG: hypothetical protein ACI4FZ_06380 [Lachnospiraceae bacterium]
MAERKEPPHLMITIVERGQGEAVARFYKNEHIFWHYQSAGFGTASSELLDVFGFGTKERDVLLSIASASTVRRLIYQLNNDLRGSIKAKGIAFHLPMSGLNKSVLECITEAELKAGQAAGGTERMEDGGMAQGSNQSLILVVVNQGHTDSVMETAKKAGARGGTILRSRFLGAEESEKLYGITLQAEKEILAIVATSQTRNHIMESVQKEHGLHTEAGAVICSMALEGNVTRLG